MAFFSQFGGFWVVLLQTIVYFGFVGVSCAYRHFGGWYKRGFEYTFVTGVRGLLPSLV